ncbi:hypothetical protein ACMFMF_009779 [Clarireedia jacksonii]
MLSPDSPIVSSQERDGNTRYCDNCREIYLDDDLAQKVEGMPKIYGRRICSLKYTQSVSSCDLCDVFRAMTRKYETHTPVLSAASPKHWLSASLRRVDESGVLLFVGYDSKGWYADDSQVLVMVDDTSTGISGRECSIDRIDFGVIKGFLSYCQENHKLCATMITIPIVDLQVIDCKSGQIVSLPGEEAYIALSYVWGSTKVDATDPKESLLSRAPKTITDTMALAIQLGISYIWVDRYCIPQDDEHRKRVLISKMGLIYSCATLTVIAAAGEDPEYGLPGVGTTKRKHATTIQVGSKRFAISRDVRRELAASKWNSRGWTYQEALLSRRRLVFTDSQFYFQCRAMHCPESLSIPLQRLHISTGERFPETLSLWKAFPNRSVGNDLRSPMSRIAEFIHRDLKFDVDALNAFQGIIEEFGISKRPVRFLSGVPLAPSEYIIRLALDKASDTSQLVFGLTWGDTAYFNFERRRLTRRMGFPSWSWLGWKVEVAEAGKIKPGPKMELFGLKSTESPFSSRLPGSFKNHLDIELELPDSTVIAWEGNEAHIRSIFDKGKIPTYLHIKGWTFDLAIKRGTSQDDWEVHWPEPTTRHKYYKPFEKCCDVNLSYIGTSELSAKVSLLILCSTAHKHPYKVCLLIKYSEFIKAHERIGICDLSALLFHSGGRGVGSKATVEERSSTHATLGHLQLVKSEIRLG